MSQQALTMLESISRRLNQSPNPDERQAIYQGLSYHHGYPVLLDTGLLFEHKHIVGPPGTGKTTLGLETDVIQLIYRNDGPVVVFDCKGDPGFFTVPATPRSGPDASSNGLRTSPSAPPMFSTPGTRGYCAG